MKKTYLAALMMSLFVGSAIAADPAAPPAAPAAKPAATAPAPADKAAAPAEKPAPVKFEDVDANKDGKVTKDEAKGKVSDEEFTKCDKDKSNDVSKAEHEECTKPADAAKPADGAKPAAEPKKDEKKEPAPAPK